MIEFETKNAVIESVKLDIGDRGCLTGWVFLDYGGTGQGFGGFALHMPNGWTHADKFSPYAGEWVMRIMQVAGVGEWGQLVGKTVRVKCSHSCVKAIGHIVKDDWFCPSEDFELLKKGTK